MVDHGTTIDDDSPSCTGSGALSSYDSIPRIPWSCITVDCKVGAGSFSCVYKVQLNLDSGGASTSSFSGRRPIASLSSSSTSSSVCIGAPKSKEDCCSLSCSHYALKRLDPKLLTGKESKFMSALDDLAIESQILAQLQHPNIIKLHGVAAGNNPRRSGYFLLLDLLHQDSLKDRIHNQWSNNHYNGRVRMLEKLKRKNKVDSKRIIPTIKQRIEIIAIKIASAMSYLHEQHIVLRDLKPGNIGFHLERTNEPIIFDFGFARTESHLNDEYTRPCIAGSPAYMSPEILSLISFQNRCNDKERRVHNANHSEALDYYAADVYSFGVVLWELVTLQKPFGRSGAENCNKQKKKNSLTSLFGGVVTTGETSANSEDIIHTSPSLELLPTKSPSLRCLIADCFATNPHHRPNFNTIIDRLQTDILSELSESSSCCKMDKDSVVAMTAPTTNKQTPSTTAQKFFKRVILKQ